SLLNSRFGPAWRTPRESAAAVEALAGYARVSGETALGCAVTVEAGGRFRRTFQFGPEDALLSENRLVVPGTELGSGPLEVTVSREGRDEVYYTAWLRYQGDEEGIRATGSDLRLRRRYFRLSRP